MIYANEIHYPINIVTIKTSILLFYLRLFGTRKGFRRTLYATEALILAWFIATLFPAIFRCNPLQDAFEMDPAILAHCIHVNPYFITTSTVNVVLDFWVLAIPLSVFWTLQLSPRRKVVLSGIFLLGLLYVFILMRFRIQDM